MTALVWVLAMPHGAALHCNGEIITIGSGNATLYIDDRSSSTGEINQWIYLEDNGQKGLQSGGNGLWPLVKNCIMGDVVCLGDACNHADPDYLIF